MLLKFGLKQTRFSSEDSQDVCVFVCLWDRVVRLTGDTLEVFEGDKVGADVLLPIDGL